MKLREIIQENKTINEVFDTKLFWIPGFESDEEKIYATAVPEDGSYLELAYADRGDSNFTDVEVQFTRRGETKLTDERFAATVFGAVINHIIEFIKEHNTKRLVFSSHKPLGNFGVPDETRSLLYKKMLDRYTRKLGWSYKVEASDTTDKFIVTRNVNENFKDGKNPGRKGLSKRMGIDTKASVSELRKMAKRSSGEKQRMAHWLANMKSGRKKANEEINESIDIIDNKNGWGAVPDNQEVDYKGLRVKMKPSVFLKLAAPLDSEPATEIIDHIKNDGKIGSPFLVVKYPYEWEDDDFSLPASVMSHEGRNRMKAILKLYGDDPIETHLFFLGGIRNRDLTSDIINNLKSQLSPERSNKILTGPLFENIINEIASAGATSAGAIASVANPVAAKFKTKKTGKYGAPEAPQQKNKDGTIKNALDTNGNLMGGKAIKR